MMPASESSNRLLQQIYQDPESLNQDQLKTIHSSPALEAELQLSQKISSSVQSLPRHEPPSILRELVFKKILEPAYRIWHIAVAMIFIILSPLVLAYASRVFQGVLEDSILITIFAFYGLLVFLLLLPLAYQLARRHEKRLEHFKSSCDDYLDHGMENARRYLSR